MPTVPDLRSGTKSLPVPVRCEADAMARRTGSPPLVEHESPALIRVSHISGALRVEAVYQHGSRGWKQSGRRLLLDGTRHKCPDVWGKYDALSERLNSDGTFALPEIVPCGEDALPTVIRENLAIARRRLAGRPGIALSTGRDARNRYVLVLTSVKATVHLLFEPLRRNGQESAQPALIDPVRMVTADGEDLTEEVNGKLHKALARLYAEPAPGADDGGTGAAQDSPAGGPSSRKGTVLRL
ncbi:hypothetical protein ABZX85_39335 [Streptomyces sp. NPDC004539]|uniref:hypothetical protein n=1 Tax=Streptomyces sp. NPDC004539 TaxID=3154280 RepID=UPI0033BF11F2